MLPCGGGDANSNGFRNHDTAFEVQNVKPKGRLFVHNLVIRDGGSLDPQQTKLKSALNVLQTKHHLLATKPLVDDLLSWKTDVVLPLATSGEVSSTGHKRSIPSFEIPTQLEQDIDEDCGNIDPTNVSFPLSNL
jgi:hypothetical protein